MREASWTEASRQVETEKRRGNDTPAGARISKYLQNDSFAVFNEYFRIKMDPVNFFLSPEGGKGLKNTPCGWTLVEKDHFTPKTVRILGK